MKDAHEHITQGEAWLELSEKAVDPNGQPNPMADRFAYLAHTHFTAAMALAFLNGDRSAVTVTPDTPPPAKAARAR